MNDYHKRYTASQADAKLISSLDPHLIRQVSERVYSWLQTEVALEHERVHPTQILERR